MDRYVEIIKQNIDSLPYGSAFVVSDFTGICDYQTGKRSLACLVDSGLIRRVIRGVYDKPSYRSAVFTCRYHSSAYYWNQVQIMAFLNFERLC